MQCNAMQYTIQYNAMQCNAMQYNTMVNDPSNNRWTHVLPKGKQFLLHMWHPSCYSYYKSVISREWGKDRILYYYEHNTYHILTLV
jgi:hypothetical protein